MTFFDSPPASYALRDGEVHVWKIPLVSDVAELGDRASILSSEETERAARFRFDRDRARFVTGRSSLRVILGRYAGMLPREIVFRVEPNGKPQLGGEPTLEFNLTHSGDFAAVAVSERSAVGIDLEFSDASFPCRDVAPDVMVPEELLELDAIPAATLHEHFFRLWCAKEAALKAIGAGFSMDPRLIRIHIDEELNPSIVSAPPELRDATLHRFVLDPGYAAALAVLGPVSHVSYLAF